MAKKVLYTIMVFILMIYICGCNKNASSDLNISEEVDPTDYCNDAVLETPEEDTEEDLEGTIGPIHTDEYYEFYWSKLPMLSSFSNGLAEISFKDGSGFIDTTGNKIIKPGIFNYVHKFTGGRVIFIDNKNKYGLINDRGEVIIAAQFDFIGEYHEGLARATVKTGDVEKYGFINCDGHMVIEAKYDYVTDFSHGLAIVRDGDKRYYVNKKGEIALEIKNALDCGTFSEELAEVRVVTSQGEKYGYINKTGEWKIPPRFDDGDPFSDGMAKVKLNEKIVYINCEGKVVIDNIEGVTFFSDFHDGLAVVKKKTEHSQDEENEYTYGYMNKKGEIVIDFKYKSADDFSEGLAYVRNHDGKYGFINTEGQYIIQPRFEEVLHFSEGLAAVYWIDDKGNDRLGYINKSGEVVIELDVDELK